MARDDFAKNPPTDYQKDGAQFGILVSAYRRGSVAASWGSSVLKPIQMIREKVDQVLVNLEDNKKPDGQRTIFHDLFTDDHLIPEEKTPERLAAEGVGIVSAGLAIILALPTRNHIHDLLTSLMF